MGWNNYTETEVCQATSGPKTTNDSAIRALFDDNQSAQVDKSHAEQTDRHLFVCRN